MSQYKRLPSMKALRMQSYIRSGLIGKVFDANKTNFDNASILSSEFNLATDVEIKTKLSKQDPLMFTLHPSKKGDDKAVLRSSVDIRYTLPAEFESIAQLWEKNVTTVGESWTYDIHKDLVDALIYRLQSCGLALYMKTAEGVFKQLELNPVTEDIERLGRDFSPITIDDVIRRCTESPDAEHTSEYASVWVGVRYPREAYTGTYPYDLTLKEKIRIDDFNNPTTWMTLIIPQRMDNGQPDYLGPFKIYHNLPPLSKEEIDAVVNDGDFPPPPPNLGRLGEDDGGGYGPDGPGYGGDDYGDGYGGGHGEPDGPPPDYEGNGYGPGYDGHHAEPGEDSEHYPT